MPKTFNSSGIPVDHVNDATFILLTLDDHVQSVNEKIFQGIPDDPVDVTVQVTIVEDILLLT